MFTTFFVCLFQRQVDWDFVSNMVKGVYLTLLKQPYVAHSAAMKVCGAEFYVLLTRLAVCYNHTSSGYCFDTSHFFKVAN